MRGNYLLRAFLPLAVYGVFTELALIVLSKIAAAVGFWPWASFLEPEAAFPWANAAAGLAAVGLFWRRYGCGREAADGDSERRLDLQREKNSCFFLLVLLGVCCCLGGSGLIFLMGEAFAEASSAGSGAAAAAAGQASSLLTLLLCSGFIIPFTEEFLFRRAMYGSLREIKCLGSLGALLLSSALFGLYHGQLQQGIYAGLLGAVLACLYQSRGNLAAPAAVHIAANLSAVLLETAHYGEWLEGSRMVLLVQTVAAVLSTVLILRRLCAKRDSRQV